ncbi:MAG: DUF1549 domain-containing protein [Bryobacteraceae bacterium]
MRDKVPLFVLLTCSVLPAAPKVDFARDVQPMLHAHCAGCHSGEKPQAGLSVLTRAGLLTGGAGGPAIQPGAGSGSLLIRRVSGTSARMPLGQEPLTALQVSLLSRWIDEGAEWDSKSPLAPDNLNTRIKLVRPEVPSSTQPNPIDAFLERDFRRNRIPVPGAAADAVFARRVYFDVTGLPPSPRELDSFVKRSEPGKRQLLIDDLLNKRQAYAEHWMTYWNDMLRNEEGVALPGEKREWITRWLFESLKENKPYNRMVQELLAPEGADAPRGFLAGVNWGGDVSASQSPAMQAAQNSAQVFLGANLRCASCHDSFVSRWKLNQTFGLAAFFTTDRLEIARCDVKTGASATPSFLFPELKDAEPPEELAQRRRQVAQMFTSPQNGRFAATLVNRYWKLLFGRGLVEPVDDIEAPSWNADLLSWLSADFVASNYDIQALLRRMMSSRAYQMESVGSNTAAKTGDTFQFRGPLRRRISAEQFSDAVSALTGEWKPLDDLTGKPATYERKWRFRSDPLTRALGRPERIQVVTERSPEATTMQALELVNGEELRTQLRRGAARLHGSFHEAPANVADSGQVRAATVKVQADIRGADRVWLVATDLGSYDRDKVVAGWMDAEFEGLNGLVRVSDLPLAEGFAKGRLQVKDEAAQDALLIRAPSSVVYDIRGKGFTTFRAVVGVDETCMRPDISGKIRFFVFTTEPGNGEFVRLTGTAPVPRPLADSGQSLVRSLFQHAFARQPNPSELGVANDLIAHGPDGIEDLLWILVMSPEFQFIR